MSDHTIVVIWVMKIFFWIFLLCILATSSYYLLLLLGPYHFCPLLRPSLHEIFPSLQLLSRVQLFVTPWITAHQASLSITKSRSSLRLTSIESVMPSSHPILCHPLLLLPPVPPSIRVFSNESTLHMRWQKYWSFSFRNVPLVSLIFLNRSLVFPILLFSSISLHWSLKKTFLFLFAIL